MPVSRHEETGVKSLSGQYSDFIAGVPFKKRRFPLIQPTSPLSEEPSSFPEDTGLLQKDHSSSQGSTISNAPLAGAPIKKRRFPLIQDSSSVDGESCSLPEENDVLHKENSRAIQISTSSSGVSDRNKNSISEERERSSDVTDAPAVKRNSNNVSIKHEEPTIAIRPSLMDNRESKERMIPEESHDGKLRSHSIEGKSELLLTPKESLVPNIGTEISKQVVKEKCKEETSMAPEGTDLSLSLKKPFPASSDLKNDEICPRQKNEEPISLNLSLSKQEGVAQGLNDAVKFDGNDSNIHSNRANWDLNTTMDAWEEPMDGVASRIVHADDIKTTGGMLDVKPVQCSSKAIGTKVDSEKQGHAECEKRVFPLSSTMHIQQGKCDKASSSSCPQKFVEEPSALSVRVNSGNASTLSIPAGVASSGNASMVVYRNVKSEPVHENTNHSLKEVISNSVMSSDSVTIKRELVEQFSVEALKPSDVSSLKLVDPKSVKSELVFDNKLDRPDKTEVSPSQFRTEMLQVLDDFSCKSKSSSRIPQQLGMEKMQELDVRSCTVEKAIHISTACSEATSNCSAELTISQDGANNGDNSAHNKAFSQGSVVFREACASTEPPEMRSKTFVKNGAEVCASGINDAKRIENENADDLEDCRLKVVDELPLHARASAEGCVSDDEKITLSADMLEDDPYDTDYESDGKYAEDIPMDIEQDGQDDDDYEDGEVREPLVRTGMEDPICEVREVQHVDYVGYDEKLVENNRVSDSVDCLTSSHNKVSNSGSCDQLNDNNGKERVDSKLNENSEKAKDKAVCLQESLVVDKPTGGVHLKKPIRILQRKSLDASERKSAPKALEKELSSEQANHLSHVADADLCTNGVVKKTDAVEKKDPVLPKMGSCANGDDAIKDANGGGNQGRIINLSVASSASSPNKTRPISGRPLSLRAGREILYDAALDGDKFQRGRDEIYIDGPHKFSRERHQDQSPRNSRLNFGRGRGRINAGRIDTLNDWDSDRDFGSGFYNGPNQFRAPRNKYASIDADSDLELSSIAPEGSFVGNGRVGRKPVGDEGPMCRHIASRRRSPGGRDLPCGRGIQMGHRFPRNISPSSRSIGGGDGSELVGLRHNDKFMRGFADDDVGPIFTRPQPGFEGMDGRFNRGSRSFPSIQRRGPPRIRSKSPIRSRNRAMGSWSSPRRRSPRRRSPDGFGGHPELTHRRSPIYGVERMRSPDRPMFPGERVVRRHGSPSYMSRQSNDIRDIDSGRDHGHPRPVIPSRSPSGRILIRNRRFDIVDPRDRNDNEEYFGGSMHPGRLLDIGGDGNGEERRRFGERRGPVRSFRTPYDDAGSEHFHLNAEDGTRPYRFCADDDSEFHERGNLREREFDRRIKNRPTNVPRRMRNIDDQEANFRHGGQVWSDDGFEDLSRVKRKRF